MAGWIAVDLDGTLAQYGGWNGGAIGEPIPAMLARVSEWITQGAEVRVFTARVAETGLANEAGEVDDRTFAEAQRELIEQWRERHLGIRLAVTATKDFGMIECWDDRSIRVMTNTGERCCERE
jgi:hypothetical protein